MAPNPPASNLSKLSDRNNSGDFKNGKQIILPKSTGEHHNDGMSSAADITAVSKKESMDNTDGSSMTSTDTGASTSADIPNMNKNNNNNSSHPSAEKSGAPPPQQGHVEGTNGSAAAGSNIGITDVTTTDSKNEGGTANALSAGSSLPGGQQRSEAVVRQPAGQVLDARQQRILENIEHRRRLLSWVRESRLASEKMVDLIARGENKSFITAILDHCSGLDSEARVEGEEALSSEIDDFRKVTSMASSSSFLKRLKSGGSTAENAATRDLRKGANVGKRMSAAVSTLNNTGDWVSSDSSASQAVGGGQPPHVAMASHHNVVPPKDSNPLIPAPNVQHTPGVAGMSTSPIPPTNQPVGKKFPSTPAHLPNIPAIAAPTNHQKSEKSQKKAKKRSSSIKNPGLGLNDGVISMNATLTQQNGSNTGGTVGGAVPNPPQTADAPAMTLSIDALEMIEKRDALIAKVDNLLQKRHLQSVKLEGGISANPSKSTGFTLQSKPKYAGVATAPTNEIVAKSVKLTQTVSFLEPLPLTEPQRLPPRRKTHWDYVLEEMRWMATDFIEERKWKVASGKTLSSAVQKHHVEAKSTKKKKTTPSRSTTPMSHRTNSSDLYSTNSKLSIKLPVGDEFQVTIKSESNGTMVSNERRASIDDTNPFYLEPSKDDVDDTRGIARLLSISVAEHWDSTLDEGVFPISDDSFVIEQRRLEILKGRAGTTDDYDSVSEASDCSESSSEMDVDTASPDCETSDGEKSSSIFSCTLPFLELNFDEILREMQASVDVVNTLKEQTRNTMEKERSLQRYRNSFKCGINLSKMQLNMVHFIEHLWKADTNCFRGDSALERRHPDASVSALLGEKMAIGKTVAACSLLWKNREAGPQLILCSPGSLHRWKFELGRVDDLEVKIAGRNGWLFSGKYHYDIQYETRDVILCDYASFLELAKIYADGKCNNNDSPTFSSLILDLRHAEPNKCHKSPSHLHSPHSEIENPKWWSALNKFALKFYAMKRLVIEKSALVGDQFSSQFASDDKVNHRDGVLAMKVAFIFHPAIFFSEQDSIGKRVISWSKRQYISKESNAALAQHESFLNLAVCSGRPMSPMLAHRPVLLASLRSVLDPVVELMSCRRDLPEDGHCTHQLEDRLCHLWELRLCSLSPLQQQAYDKCCYHVRGPLSQSYEAIIHSDTIEGRRPLGRAHITELCDEAHEKMAKALMQLRKVCIHSNIDDFNPSSTYSFQQKIKSIAIRGLNGRSLLQNIAGKSEPDINIASEIASKSSKMRELLSILTDECGYSLPAGCEFSDIPKAKNEAKVEEACGGKNSFKRRVLILATLIEAQLLTSFFLSALGLHHEVLVSGIQTGVCSKLEQDTAPSPVECNDTDHLVNFEKSSNLSPAIQNTISWAWGQNVLASFNSMTCSESSDDFRTYGIIVASPTAMSSRNGGICAASADFVISIDEDWSGRDAVHTASILTKIRCCGQGVVAGTAAPPCKFIKIVSRNTCEDTFLCRGKTKELTDAEFDALRTDLESATPKRETRKRSARMSTRRSPRGDRQPTDVPKQSNDEKAASSPSESDASSTPKLYCPINVQLTNEEINNDGFLAPSDGVSDYLVNVSKNTESSVGSNIARQRNTKLSAVLCLPDTSSYQNLQFMPYHTTGGSAPPIFSDYNLINMFTLALIKAEEDASYFSTSKSSANITSSDDYETGFDLRPTAFMPSSLALSALARRDLSSSSIRYYVKLTGNKSSTAPFNYRKASSCLKLPARMLSIQEATNHNGTNNDNKKSSMKQIEKNKVVKSKPVDRACSLILYNIPNDHTNQRRVETFLEPVHQSFCQSCFSLCFSSSDGAEPVVVCDQNQGSEPLTYFPSFLPALLQMIQNISTASANMTPSNRIKRKSYDGMSDLSENKRLKTPDPLDGMPPISLQSSDDPFDLPDLQLSPTGSLNFDPSLMPSNNNTSESDPGMIIEFFVNENVETNRLFTERSWGGQCNIESFFTKKLLSYDIEGALSCQQRPKMGSMIMVTQKTAPNCASSIPREFPPPLLATPQTNAPSNNHASDTNDSALDLASKSSTNTTKKSSGKKKVKKSYNNRKTFSLQDRLTRPGFGDEFLRKRTFSMRDGIKYDFVASLLGMVRFRFRLNDMVSSSFVTMEPISPVEPGRDMHVQPLPSTALTRIHVGELPYDARVGTIRHHGRIKHYSGIALPMGVRTPRFAKQLSSSLEETDEPWTHAEDSLLNDCVSRYGRNWYLAAHAVSDSMSNPAMKSRRSPAQCRDRWESVEETFHKAEISTESATDAKRSLSIEVIPWFQKSSADSDNDALICYSSSAFCRSLQAGPERDIDKADQPASRLTARIKILKEMSKKKRVIPITIPGKNASGTDPAVRLVPIHPSHAESVQTARITLASSSNGVAPPPEMWPLKLLEFADKHRAAALKPATVQQTAPRVPATQPRLSMQQPPPRPPVPQPRPPVQQAQPNPSSYYPYSLQQKPPHNRHN